MIKLIKKADCKFQGNRIIYKNNIVPINSHVWMLLNQLEQWYQQALYVSNQPDGAKGPTLDGFEFESVVDDLPYAVPNTPTLDAKVQETLAYLEDIDTIEFCKKLNEVIKYFGDLYKFIRSEYIEDNLGWERELDHKYVGNPLALTEARLTDMIEFIVKQDDRYEICRSL